MAKFNVEVDLDWLDDETTIDEEIRERVIKGAEDYLLQTTTDEIEKKIEGVVGKKQLEKLYASRKSKRWVPIQEFIGEKFNAI